MKWSYAVTTVPERVLDGCLASTLFSLEKAGFPRPRIFLDGDATDDGSPFQTPRWLRAYPLTVRSPRVYAAANWTLGMLEMTYRDPEADRYAMFQDDVMLCSGVREYVDASWPKPVGTKMVGSYLNLATYPVNEQPWRSGWHGALGRGKGAQALVFDRDGARALLGAGYMLSRSWDVTTDGRGLFGTRCGQVRGRKNIDGGVADGMEKVGYQEMVHWPSLAGHVVEQPSAIGNPTQPEITSWRGEEWDARSLLHDETPSVAGLPRE